MMFQKGLKERLPRRLLFEFEEACSRNGANGEAFTSREREVPTCDVTNNRVLRWFQTAELRT